MKKIKIFWKINIILVIIILIILTLFIILPIDNTITFLDSTEQVKSVALTKALALDNLDALLSNSYEIAQQNRKSLMSNSDLNIQYIFLIDPYGFILDYGYKGFTEDQNKKFYSTGKTMFTDKLSKEALTLKSAKKFFYHDELNSIDVMEVAVPLDIGKRKYGTLRVGYNLRVFNSFISETLGSVIAILIISLILGIVGSTILSHNITSRINRLATFSREVILGNLNQRFDEDSHDEIGVLGSLINMFVTDFASIVRDTKNRISSIFTSGENLDVVAKEGLGFMEAIDNTIEKTSDNVKDQLNNVELTSETINNIITSIGQVSHNYNDYISLLNKDASAIERISSDLGNTLGIIKQTYKISESLTQFATEGNESVKNSIDAINKINASSKQISDISLVISNVAEQTNLLAMNAAIEAAHAGEHGKGFSVVADEIRKLAESTSTSTKSIITLIKDITSKISKGVELSSLVEISLKRIIEGIKQTSDFIIIIKNSMEQQVDEAKNIYGTTVNLVDLSKNISHLLDDQIQKEHRILEVMKLLEGSSVNVKNVSEEQKEKTKQMTFTMQRLNEVVQNNDRVLTDLIDILERFSDNPTDLTELK